MRAAIGTEIPGAHISKFSNSPESPTEPTKGVADSEELEEATAIQMEACGLI